MGEKKCEKCQERVGGANVFILREETWQGKKERKKKGEEGQKRKDFKGGMEHRSNSLSPTSRLHSPLDPIDCQLSQSVRSHLAEDSTERTLDTISRRPTRKKRREKKTKKRSDNSTFLVSPFVSRLVQIVVSFFFSSFLESSLDAQVHPLFATCLLCAWCVADDLSPCSVLRLKNEQEHKFSLLSKCRLVSNTL